MKRTFDPELLEKDMEKALEITGNPQAPTIIDFNPDSDSKLARILGGKRIRKNTGWCRII
jgi:hypothetical protein